MNNPSCMMLHYYLEKLDEDLQEILNIRAELAEQQKRVTTTLAKAEQYAASVQLQISDLNDTLGSSPTKRTLN